MGVSDAEMGVPVTLGAEASNVPFDGRGAARTSSQTRRRGTVVRRALAAGDVVALTIAFVLAIAAAGDGSPQNLPVWLEALVFVCTLPVWIVVAKANGLYDRDEIRPDHSTVDELSGVAQLVTLGTWSIFLFSSLTHVGDPAPLKLALFWLFAIVLVPIGRATARHLCHHAPGYVQNTLIVGRNPTARLVEDKIRRHPEYGLNVIGLVNEVDGQNGATDPVTGSPVLGSLTDLGRLAERHDVERVVIASSFEAQHSALTAIHALKDRDIHVDVVPHLYEFVSPSTGVHAIEGLLLLGLPPLTLSRSSRFVKRLLDVAGSALGLVVCAPFWLLVALAIKLDSRGPVLFRQVRMGAGDRTFTMLKFRTMVVDAEEQKDLLADLNHHRRNGQDACMFKAPDDPRVTRVGRFLRRFSLDEIPQLVNVLKGEMSLVGPRPLVLDEHEHVQQWARKRLELRPGITGLWQVLGRSDIPFPEMVRLDYVYVTSWSLGGDLRILLKTAPAVFRAREAY
jgi:exopolysaccharide biosynthesis polyprenyl glycosylphosphotransferase